MEYARRLKIRKDEMGLTWLKMDLGIKMVAKIPGTVTMPSGETLGNGVSCRTSSPPPRSPKKASRSSANTWRPRARPWAWRSRSPWITWATWA
jgi:hypothetical protein